MCPAGRPDQGPGFRSHPWKVNACMAVLYRGESNYKRCFHLILLFLLPWPNPLSPQALPSSPSDSLHPQPSVLPRLLCLALNHFFLAWISPCRTASNQEVTGPRTLQGTLPGRGLRRQSPDHLRKSNPETCQPLVPSTAGDQLLRVGPGQEAVVGGCTSSAELLSGKTSLGVTRTRPMWPSLLHL